MQQPTDSKNLDLAMKIFKVGPDGKKTPQIIQEVKKSNPFPAAVNLDGDGNNEEEEIDSCYIITNTPETKVVREWVKKSLNIIEQNDEDSDQESLF